MRLFRSINYYSLLVYFGFDKYRWIKLNLEDFFSWE